MVKKQLNQSNTMKEQLQGMNAFLFTQNHIHVAHQQHSIARDTIEIIAYKSM